MTEPLRRTALACHLVLALAVAGAIVAAGRSWISAVAAAVAVAPLAATLPGIRAGQPRASSWAALLTVIYAAGATVEIVATRGGAPFAALALLAALCELALLFALSRRLRASRG